MKLANGPTLLTVKDIAERISYDRSEDGLARTLRQVRHWTQNDLLETISEKNTGKGVPRFYDYHSSLIIAGILLELSRYGATVDILKPVADNLYESFEDDRSQYMLWQEMDENSYLQVAWNTDPSSGRFMDAVMHMFDDLDKGYSGNELMSEPTSSVVINMSKLRERIFPGDTYAT